MKQGCQVMNVQEQGRGSFVTCPSTWGAKLVFTSVMFSQLYLNKFACPLAMLQHLVSYLATRGGNGHMGAPYDNLPAHSAPESKPEEERLASIEKCWILDWIIV